MAPTMRAERFYADTKTVALEVVPIFGSGPGEDAGPQASGTICKLGPAVDGWD